MRGRRRVWDTVIRLSTIRLSISPGLAAGWDFMTNEWGQTNEWKKAGLGHGHSLVDHSLVNFP